MVDTYALLVVGLLFLILGMVTVTIFSSITASAVAAGNYKEAEKNAGIAAGLSAGITLVFIAAVAFVFYRQRGGGETVARPNMYK